MKLYRQKIFFDVIDVLETPGLSPAGGISGGWWTKKIYGENHPLVVNKGIQNQDVKNGNYMKALKHGFYVPKKDRDAWINGTYEGQRKRR